MTNLLRTRGLGPLVLVTVGALALATVAGVALTHGTMPGTGMWHAGGTWTDGHMSGWGLPGWGMLLFGLLWMTVLLAIPAYLVYRLATRSAGGSRSEDGALTVLREQYARGEVDDEESERRRSRLAHDESR